MRTLRALIQDVHFQFRHGFYFVYLFVTAAYIALLWYIPEQVQDMLTTVLIFSDPSTLGFFFVGGIVLLERDQQILDTLFVTPLKIREYLFARAISLSIIAVATSVLIKGTIIGFDSDLTSLIFGVIVTSIITTLLGINLAVRVSSVNQYLIVSPIFLTILYIPVLQMISLIESPFLHVIPSQASLFLIGSSSLGSSWMEKVLAVGYLCMWMVIVYKWTYSVFYQHVVQKVGGGSR